MRYKHFFGTGTLQQCTTKNWNNLEKKILHFSVIYFMFHQSFKKNQHWINVYMYIVISIEWTYLAKYGWEGPMIPYAIPMPIWPNQIKGIKLVNNGLISFNNRRLVILTQIWKLTNRMLFLDIYQNILFRMEIKLYVLE